MKIINSNGDKTKKKTQMVTKLKNLSGDKNQKLKLWTIKNSKCDKTQMVTKLKLWPNSNCDKTQIVTKLQLWHNSKIQIVRNFKDSNYDKTQKLNWDKTWIMTNLKWNRTIADLRYGQKGMISPRILIFAPIKG